MLFYCYADGCQLEHECLCDNRCCSGVYYSPRVWSIDDEDLTDQEKVGLVYYHLCPECGRSVEQ